MIRSDPTPGPRLWTSVIARELADLPEQLRLLLDRGLSEDVEARGVVVATASEIIRHPKGLVPEWVDTETFYLVFTDVPVPALMRLPTLLRLHKPDQRLHVTRDAGALRRLLVAQKRQLPEEGIVDAYAVGDELVLVLGDLTVQSFPRDQVPPLADRGREALQEFEIDSDGSYLRWPEMDVDLGVSSLLQAVDPTYLADVEIERIAEEDTGAALRAMREERGLRQKDISGLGERQVRRLESGESRLTAGAARKIAKSFDLSVARFLELMGGRLGWQKTERMSSDNPKDEGARV